MEPILLSSLTQSKVNTTIFLVFFFQIFSFDRQVTVATKGHVNLLETY